MNVPLAPMSFLHTYFCGGDLRGKVAPQRSLQEITNEASNYDCSARPIYSKIFREIEFHIGLQNYLYFTLFQA